MWVAVEDWPGFPSIGIFVFNNRVFVRGNSGQLLIYIFKEDET
jgi:hypothetical protein